MSRIFFLFLSLVGVAVAEQWEPVVTSNSAGGTTDIYKLTGSAAQLEPDLSGDGRRIAFVRHWTSIWIAAANGTNEELLVQLEDSLNVVSHPRWSPDGTEIVYAAGIGHSREGGKTSIWRIRLSDRKIERLFADHAFGGFNEISCSWSPDGSQLAVNALNNGNEELLMLDLVSRKISVLTGGLEKIGYPAWTPDGTHILINGDTHTNGNFWLLPVADGPAVPVNSAGMEGNYGRYSPDGKWISFHVKGETWGKNQVYIMPRDGGQPLLITQFDGFENVSKASWLASSKELLVEVEPPRPDKRVKLAIIDTSGTNLRILVDNGDEFIFWGRTAWSPDEQSIAYTVAANDTTIRFVDLTTGISTDITSGNNPTWSPFGDEIAFARGGNIWSRQLETGIESQVTLNLENAGQPAWSPTGEQIAFRQNGLWLVSAYGGEPTKFAERAGLFNWANDGTKVWAHNNASNQYNGIWGDTWVYPVKDAPQAGYVWGGSEGHVPFVAGDGSYVVSFHWFQGSGIIIQQPHKPTGKNIFTGDGGLRPTFTTASPSGTRIAFFLEEPWYREIWKIDISQIVQEQGLP